ncbi:hypothetical protein [Lysobacter gummosus]
MMLTMPPLAPLSALVNLANEAVHSLPSGVELEAENQMPLATS